MLRDEPENCALLWPRELFRSPLAATREADFARTLFQPTGEPFAGILSGVNFALALGSTAYSECNE
jgi:hypothetical protein